MKDNVIQWSVANWIMVVLMAAVGAMAHDVIQDAVKRDKRLRREHESFKKIARYLRDRDLLS